MEQRRVGDVRVLRRSAAVVAAASVPGFDGITGDQLVPTAGWQRRRPPCLKNPTRVRARRRQVGVAAGEQMIEDDASSEVQSGVCGRRRAGAATWTAVAASPPADRRGSRQRDDPASKCSGATAQSRRKLPGWIRCPGPR